jgi:hypothetical protein
LTGNLIRPGIVRIADIGIISLAQIDTRGSKLEEPYFTAFVTSSCTTTASSASPTFNFRLETTSSSFETS